MLFLLPVFFACSQTPIQKVNSYSFIKSYSKPNDSVKVKQGYWIESDTLIYDRTSSAHVDHGDNRIIYGPKTFNIAIMVSKGTYKDNMKAGTWQYFSWNNKLCKEVNYYSEEEGGIKWVKFYYSSGTLFLKAELKGNSFHYEKYDKAGKKISEGDVPAELISTAQITNYW